MKGTAKLQGRMMMKISLVIKLVSIVVHVDELRSPKGSVMDIEALKPLLADPEVMEFVKEMGVLAPLKR